MIISTILADNMMFNNFEAIATNSLVDLTDPDYYDNDNEEPMLLQSSPYYDHESLIQLLHTKRDIFKCISVNIQSLNAR